MKKHAADIEGLLPSLPRSRGGVVLPLLGPACRDGGEDGMLKMKNIESDTTRKGRAGAVNFFVSTWNVSNGR